MTTCESYWIKTGYKFVGTDEELENQLATCGKQMELADIIYNTNCNYVAEAKKIIDKVDEVLK